MKLISNIGTERVVDVLRNCLNDESQVDIATSAFSLFAFAETRELLERLSACRIVVSGGEGTDLKLLGTDADRSFRNRLTVPWLAGVCRDWLSRKGDIREVPAMLPQPHRFVA